VYKHLEIFNVVSEVDLIPMAVTFIACLGIGLDYGMLTGIGINLMFILYNSARPKVQVRNLTVSLLLVKYIYGCMSVRFSGTNDYNE
jgi:MFS superfamily sulfate permease-like transporter